MLDILKVRAKDIRYKPVTQVDDEIYASDPVALPSRNAFLLHLMNSRLEPGWSDLYIHSGAVLWKANRA